MDIITLLLVLGILVGIVILLTPSKKKLTKKEYDLLVQKIEKTKLLDPNFSIIESHKIFIAGMKKIVSSKKNISAVETIRHFEKRFKNREKIWEMHKLRNKLAHEEGIKITERKAEVARKEIISALSDLL